MEQTQSIGELIPVTSDGEKVAVNARQLHSYLGSKQDFSNWMKKRISKYGFVENQDYEVFDNFIENPQGGRPTRDYAISLDMAKELCMVEGTEKGKEARRYFIAKEKELRQIQTQMQIPQTPMEYIAKLAADAVEREKAVRQLEQKTALALESAQKATEKIEQMEKEKAEAKAKLAYVELSEENVPESTQRMKVRKLVDQYSAATGIEHRAVYEKIYSEVYYFYRVSIKARKKLPQDRSWLDVAERIGALGMIYNIISSMIRNLPTRQLPQRV